LAPGAFTQLDHDAAIGIRAWDQQACIRLRVGPLDRAAFERLLPGRPALRRFVALVRAYVGYEIGFSVNLVLRRAEVPPLALAADADPSPRLGWNTWLPITPPMQRDRDAADALFDAALIEG
jgi:type VI secretion system protein ImpH